MVLGLHMDEEPTPHGTTLYDVSGSGNHGVVYRAALELAYTNDFEEVWSDIRHSAGTTMVPIGDLKTCPPGITL